MLPGAVIDRYEARTSDAEGNQLRGVVAHIQSNNPSQLIAFWFAYPGLVKVARGMVHLWTDGAVTSGGRRKSEVAILQRLRVFARGFLC